MIKECILDSYSKDMSFRLLNSEIGNDRKCYVIHGKYSDLCFRLLNSEIGNDRYIYEILE